MNERSVQDPSWSTQSWLAGALWLVRSCLEKEHEVLCEVSMLDNTSGVLTVYSWQSEGRRVAYCLVRFRMSSPSFLPGRVDLWNLRRVYRQGGYAHEAYVGTCDGLPAMVQGVVQLVRGVEAQQRLEGTFPESVYG